MPSAFPLYICITRRTLKKKYILAVFTLQAFCLDDGQPDNPTFLHYCFISPFPHAVPCFSAVGVGSAEELLQLEESGLAEAQSEEQEQADLVTIASSDSEPRCAHTIGSELCLGASSAPYGGVFGHRLKLLGGELRPQSG